jgi:hypothetical protein
VFSTYSPVFKDRLPSAATALLIQILFIAAFLHAFSQAPPARKELAHEITFFLPRLSPIQRQKATPRVVAPPSLKILRLPDNLTVPPPIVAPPATADVQGFGKSLFGCAPENLYMLTPQDRERCNLGFAPPDGTAVIEPPSQVKDPTRRLAELAERNTPVQVPCVHMTTRDLAPGFQDRGFMANPICVIKGMLNGFHLTNLPP